jgi:glycosyltransferase involved in cell wall biosynthesis
VRPELDPQAFAISWRRRQLLPPLLPSGVSVSQRAMPARPLHRAWARWHGPAIERFVGSIDVVHGTNFVVPPSRRAARVVTVHDLTIVRFPQLCDRPTLRFVGMVRRAIDDGAWVHTHSRFVADEIVETFGADPARVRAVAPGVPPHGSSSPHGPRPDLPPGTSRYVLAIGTVEPRKDYPGLMRAFGHVAAAHPDVALVIAGADGWGADAFHLALAESRYRQRVLQLGYATDDELGLWLEHAEVLAFPSLYEGFGFPPLEAMAHDVPVVAATAGAVPEVVGDAAILVVPRDIDALAHALVRVLDDAGERSTLVAKGRRRVAGFTWEACGEGLATLYADAAAAR